MIDGPLVGINQGHQLGEKHLADRLQFALALEHTGEFSQVGFQPVLLAIAFGGFSQIGNHRVDVILQFGYLASGLYLDGTRQIALGHRRRDFGNRANLRGEVGGEQVDVAGEILPRAGRTGDVRLTTEPPVHTDFARHVGNLIGKGCERSSHVVNGVSECRNLTFRLHSQALSQVAVRHGGHYFYDATDLFGQVRCHEIYVVC